MKFILIIIFLTLSQFVSAQSSGGLSDPGDNEICDVKSDRDCSEPDGDRPGDNYVIPGIGNSVSLTAINRYIEQQFSNDSFDDKENFD